MCVENTFWITDIIIPFICAMIGGGISLFIFKQGIKSNLKKEKFKKKKEKSLTEKYFLSNILAVIQFIEVQLNEILNTSRKIKKYENLDLRIYPELKLTELRLIDFKELYLIFVIEKKGSFEKKSVDFVNLKNCLENIENFITEQKSSNISTLKYLEKIINDWNNNFKQFQVFLNKNTSETYSDTIDIICKKHYIKNKKHLNDRIDIVFENFISPLKEELMKTSSSSTNLYLIIEYINNFENIYMEYINLYYTRRREVLLEGKKLSNVKFLMKESLTKLKNRKTK